MKTNACSTASAWWVKRCICPCEVGTKITYGGSNIQLSMYKFHKRGQQLFFVFLFYGNEIHTCAAVKDHTEDKIILYIISHNIYSNRGTALSTSKIYTYLKSNRSMIFLERSIANMTCKLIRGVNAKLSLQYNK